MKFYDNKRNEHDTRIGALCGSLFNTVGGFLEDKIPGLNIFDEMAEDVIDGDYRDITEDEFDEDNFFDPEEDVQPEEPPITVGEVVETYGIKFKLDITSNTVEIINTLTNEVIDKITVTKALTEGFLTPELEKYISRLKTKESIDSLKECLDQVSAYNS